MNVNIGSKKALSRVELRAFFLISVALILAPVIVGVLLGRVAQAIQIGVAGMLAIFVCFSALYSEQRELKGKNRSRTILVMMISTVSISAVCFFGVGSLDQRGYYIIVERGGRSQVLLEREFNFSDVVIAEVPAIYRMGHARGYLVRTDGSDFKVGVRLTSGTIYLPPNRKQILRLHDRLNGRALEDVVLHKVASMAVRMGEALSWEERAALSSVTFTFDVPINDEFEGLGLEVLHDRQIRCNVWFKRLSDSEPEPTQKIPRSRTFNVSDLT